MDEKNETVDLLFNTKFSKGQRFFVFVGRFRASHVQEYSAYNKRIYVSQKP